MAKMTRQRQIAQATQPKAMFEGITIGTVVDTNDPQQMGRIRVVCPTLNDRFDSEVGDIPWAMYATPFGGSVSRGTRGPNEDTTHGPVAYGMWAIPKIGAQVLIMCIDGSPMQRVWLGCVYGQFTPHTLPHGRYFGESSGLLPEADGPIGPVSTTEEPIQPLFNNLKEAFDGSGSGPTNYERKTRGADYSVSSVVAGVLHTTFSHLPDDKGKQIAGKYVTQGYGESNITPGLGSDITGLHYDSLVYSITTPGFHSISMDDRDENCRMRFRTTAGHQIILDDTNERIYISTAKGKNWIEIDQEGNIDVFTENKLSIHAKKDINFISDESIRMHAKKGIHMYSEDDIRIQSTKNVHLKAGVDILSHSAGNTVFETDNAFHVKSGSVLNLTSAVDTNILANGGNIIQTGTLIHFNGPAATPALSANEQPAKFVNRVPMHEPWARSMTKNDSTLEPELSYDDPNVGRIEREQPIPRGKNWQR
jgi:phage baseplate assembly protein gpV